jgi:hypothetical protein
MGLFDRFRKKAVKDNPIIPPDAVADSGDIIITRNDINRDVLLDNFLSRIMPPEKNRQVAGYDRQPADFKTLSGADYPVLPVSTKLEKKIRELNAIAESIEKRKPDRESLVKQDFTKFRINYAHALNPAQLAGVACIAKPVLCIAGAGSGKTRVIVYRVSYLIENGVDPQSILLLTFTRKAAQEMLFRVETLLQDKNVGKVTGGTFHSFASYVLRKYANMSLSLTQGKRSFPGRGGYMILFLTQGINRVPFQKLSGNNFQVLKTILLTSS